MLWSLKSRKFGIYNLAYTNIAHGQAIYEMKTIIWSNNETEKEPSIIPWCIYHVISTAVLGLKNETDWNLLKWIGLRNGI